MPQRIFNLIYYLGRCYNGTDLSEPDANYNLRVIGHRKKHAASRNFLAIVWLLFLKGKCFPILLLSVETWNAVLCVSVQSGVSQQQSATDGGSVSSNMSVRSAAAAAVDGFHPQTSSSSGVRRPHQLYSGSSPDSAAGFRHVIRATISTAGVLLATQFAARHLRCVL